MHWQKRNNWHYSLSNPSLLGEKHLDPKCLASSFQHWIKDWHREKKRVDGSVCSFPIHMGKIVGLTHPAMWLCPTMSDTPTPSGLIMTVVIQIMLLVYPNRLRLASWMQGCRGSCNNLLPSGELVGLPVPPQKTTDPNQNGLGKKGTPKSCGVVPGIWW